MGIIGAAVSLGAVAVLACGDPAAAPDAAPPTVTEVMTTTATSLGRDGLSANGRIQPHGAPASYWFEYGPTTAYGSRTETRTLGPRLAAYYRESWDDGLAGWRGGSGADLVHVASGGASGGFVRYTEPTGDDYNHVDGIGLLHLVQYFYPGIFDADAPTAAFGGGDPDFRDARIRVAVRGVDWVTSGSELLWWSQIDTSHGDPARESKYSNWAHTGFFLTDALFSGAWETVEYRLENDTTAWTYAGTNRELEEQQGRNVYVYAPLDDVLRHLDVDVFHLLAYTSVDVYPSGSIDFDDLEIAYRNHSVLLPSNGGTLASAPPGDDAAALTDGWRHGEGHGWVSAADPAAPLELVYQLARPVTVERVQIHNHPEWPSADVEVLGSLDGVAWTTIAAGTLPATADAGPGDNFLYWLAKGLDVEARQIKVRVLGGYRPEAWGLGEIEVFGRGAEMATEDDWHHVNDDLTGLTAGETVHLRLVAQAGDEIAYGDDVTYEVPDTSAPEVTTGRARMVEGGVRVEGRLNTLGGEAMVHFEYGPDASYGGATPAKRAGPEITPRTVLADIDDVSAGATVHYRLVAEGIGEGSEPGLVYGADATFVVP